MNDIAIRNAEAYVVKHALRTTAQLGFGVHGNVYAVEDKVKGDRSAIKAHLELAPYQRECVVYRRLKERGITSVLGFHVPQLLRTDDALRVIEMTIVTRPFVLDFAGAYLDARPEFSQEVWEEWEAGKREQFGSKWAKVRAIIDSFEGLGIYLADVTPSNVAFGD